MRLQFKKNTYYVKKAWHYYQAFYKNVFMRLQTYRRQTLNLSEALRSLFA